MPETSLLTNPTQWEYNIPLYEKWLRRGEYAEITGQRAPGAGKGRGEHGGTWPRSRRVDIQAFPGAPVIACVRQTVSAKQGGTASILSPLKLQGRFSIFMKEIKYYV